MKHMRLLAISIILLITASCSNPVGPTGKVFDLKSGAIAVELRTWGEGTIGVDESSIREHQGKHLVTWFTYKESKPTAYFTTEFDCKERRYKVLQAGNGSGHPLPHDDSTRLVLPKSNEEVVMDYLC